jgi:dolichyl-phosphate-mannose--protein O-mannosyl transferase
MANVRVKRVWQKESTYIMFHKVKTGASDGINTEISDTQLKEGDDVITGIIHEKTTTGTTQKSPFMPSMPKGGGRRM